MTIIAIVLALSALVGVVLLAIRTKEANEDNAERLGRRIQDLEFQNKELRKAAREHAAGISLLDGRIKDHYGRIVSLEKDLKIQKTGASVEKSAINDRPTKEELGVLRVQAHDGLFVVYLPAQKRYLRRLLGAEDWVKDVKMASQYSKDVAHECIRQIQKRGK